MSLLLKSIILYAILIAASSEERKFVSKVSPVAESDLKGDVGKDDHEIDVDNLQSDDHVKHYANKTVTIAEHGRFTGTSYRSKRMRKLDDDEDIILEYYKRRRPDYDDEDRRRPDYDDEDRRKPYYDDERRRPDYDDEDRRRPNDKRRRRPAYDDEDRRRPNDNRRRRPGFDDEDRRRPNDNRRQRPAYDDEDRRRPNGNRRRRPGFDDEGRSIKDYNERSRRPHYGKDTRRLYNNTWGRNFMNLDGNCQTCGKMLEENSSMSGYRARVINGRVVQPTYKYPWIVSLIGANCGGAIISATYIITASHCLLDSNKSKSCQCTKKGVLPKNCFIDPKEISVGLLPQRQKDKLTPVKIAQLIPHDEFQIEKGVLHDIALIKLAAPIQCNKLSSPICLPTEDLQKIGEKLIVAGWGISTVGGKDVSERLREGTVKQVKVEICQDLTKGFENKLPDIICATGTESEQISCTGDSGSSIFAPFENKFYTLGITSQGSSSECQTNMPVIYAKVYRYMDWIKSHVKDLPSS